MVKKNSNYSKTAYGNDEKDTYMVIKSLSKRRNKTAYVFTFQKFEWEH